MVITVEAVYEGGVLKPKDPLPLREHEAVQITVRTTADAKGAPPTPSRGCGLLPWTGSVEDLDYLIEGADNDPLEGP